MARASKKSFHTDTLKKTITIRASPQQVWRHISNVMGLAAWADGVTQVRRLSDKTRGIGAVRLISFADGNTVEEHIVAWNSGESFTYVATHGLPLRAYVATLSIRSLSDGTVKLQWQSYLNSQSMTLDEFSDFYTSLRSFYRQSLENLKMLIEDGLR